MVVSTIVMRDVRRIVGGRRVVARRFLLSLDGLSMRNQVSAALGGIAACCGSLQWIWRCGSESRLVYRVLVDDKFIIVDARDRRFFSTIPSTMRSAGWISRACATSLDMAIRHRKTKESSGA